MPKVTQLTRGRLQADFNFRPWLWITFFPEHSQKAISIEGRRRQKQGWETGV